MKTYRLLLLLSGALAAPAFAGISAATIVLPTDNPKPAPAVCLVQPADYLCAVVTIRSAAKDPEKQANAMRETLQRVTAAVEKSSRYQLHQGAVRFGGNSGSSYSKSSASPATLQTSVRILSPLLANTDVYEAMKELRKFVATFQPADETDLNLAAVTLAVASPEQYRERLLALIADQSRSLQQTLGARNIAIDGLQNAVTVRQLDDLNVEVFIDYLISANVESR